MWDFSIGKTIAIMARTLPYIFLRMAIYFGITLAYMVAIGAGAGVGYGLGKLSDDPTAYVFIGGAFGFGFVSLGVYWIREYILYVVKAGHIAVMVSMLDGKPLPDGKGQLQYGREVVTARFGETTVLFALDQLIKGVISAITGLIWFVGAVIPIPGLDGLVRFVNAVIRMSLTYVDEIILAYNIRINSQNPWETARQGLVLYAQNGKVMVKNALWLTIILYVVAFAVFIFLLAPVGTLLYFFSDTISGWSFVVALVFAWAFKAAVLEPFAIASLAQVYFKVIEGQVPNPEWDQKLSNASQKFRDIKDKALGAHA